MHIGYAPPDGTFAVTGTGATIVNDVAGLTDGLPDQATRFTFVTGAQTTASVLKIQRTFSAASLIGCAGIFSTNLPAGTLIKILGKRPADSGYTYDLGGNSQTQRVFTRDDGSNVCIWLFADGIDPISACEISIYNDVNGSASIVAGAYFDIGEIFIAPRFYIEIDANWKSGLAGIEVGRSSKTRQPVPVLFPPGRVLNCTSSVITYTLARGIPASGPNLERLRYLIGLGQVCMATVLAKGDDGLLDPVRLQNSTLLAICTKFDDIVSGRGGYCSTAMQFFEIPG